VAGMAAAEFLLIDGGSLIFNIAETVMHKEF
jgi:hypothetical protein